MTPGRVGRVRPSSILRARPIMAQSRFFSVRFEKRAGALAGESIAFAEKRDWEGSDEVAERDLQVSRAFLW